MLPPAARDTVLGQRHLAQRRARLPPRLAPGEYVEVHKLLGIVVELSPGGEEVFSERVSAVLRAWARLVEIGAFAGDNGVHSWAQPPRVQLGLEDEIELTLEDAHVPADAYAPLLVALDEIDRAGQAIGRLEAGP